MKLTKTTMGLTALAVLASAGQSFSAVMFDGNTSGKWTNPVGGEVSEYEIANGNPVSTFAWGNPRNSVATDSKSELTFTGIDPFGPVACGESFDIGLVDYFNGTVARGTSATGVDLEVDINFTSPLGGPINFSYTLTLTSTPDGNTLGGVADFVTLPEISDQVFTLDGYEYTLQVSFDGASEFVVDENDSARTKLVGKIKCETVPESGSSLALLGVGMLLVSGVRRKLKANC